MPKIQYIKVANDHSQQRIDNFLIGKFNFLPKPIIYRWIRKGELRVNKKRVKQFYRVIPGDIIRIPPHVKAEIESVKIPLDHLKYLESHILLENEDYLIIDKPPGIPVHQFKNNGGLIERLRILRPSVKKLELAHRLDKNTSGCIIIAKKYSILRYFHQEFREKRISKIYHALVHKKWPEKINKINLRLCRSNLLNKGNKKEKIVQVDQNNGKESVTFVKIIEQYDNKYTLLEAIPLTGRTHQIRVHLAHYGCPIVYDQKYGFEKSNNLLDKKEKSFLLNAHKLSFIDPKSKKIVCVKARPDKRFSHFIKNYT